MAIARRFRIGSATIVFAIASCAWFAFVWRTMLGMLPKIVTDPEPRAIRYAVIATIPMLVVTAIALITVNMSQSEGVSWLFAIVAFVVTAVGFVLWIGPYTLAAA
jgi:hypothetical protein